MKIGIIGVGNVGATLVKKLSQLGHHVKMTNASGLNKLTGLAQETGALAVEASEVATDVGMLIITIPLRAVPELPKNLWGKLANDVIVVDTCNYYPMRDGEIAEVNSGMTESAWVESQIGRPVIKAFNSILANSLLVSARPKGAAARVALPISGQDPAAKQLVASLIDAMGFDSLDAGTIADSWRHQPASPAYCTDYDRMDLEVALARAVKSSLPQTRDDSVVRFLASAQTAPLPDAIRLNRELFA